MAYLDLEFRNARLLWDIWGDRVLACALIAAGLMFASIVAAYMVPGPMEFVPQP
jgi:hypothetical protein